MTSQHRFLIVSNPRTGSTWLETSLGELPDVAVKYELKWGPALPSPPAGVQRAIGGAAGSCAAVMDEISTTAPVVGSKLVLSGKLFPPGQTDELKGTLGGGLSIIHLTRRYFDILLSARGHGGVHSIGRAPRHDRNTEMVDTLSSTSVEKLNAIQRKVQTQIVDCPVGYRILSLRRRFLGGRPVTYMAYDEIIGMLLAFFFNDLVLLQVRPAAAGWVHAPYERVRDDFPRLAEFAGSSATADEVRAVIDSPVTCKLDSVQPDMFRNHRAIAAVAALLDEARDRALARGAALADYWRWSADGRTAEIEVDGLAQAVAAGRPGLLPRRAAGRSLRWDFGREIGPGA